MMLLSCAARSTSGHGAREQVPACSPMVLEACRRSELSPWVQVTPECGFAPASILPIVSDPTHFHPLMAPVCDQGAFQ